MPFHRKWVESQKESHWLVVFQNHQVSGEDFFSLIFFSRHLSTISKNYTPPTPQPFNPKPPQHINPQSTHNPQRFLPPPIRHLLLPWFCLQILTHLIQQRSNQPEKPWGEWRSQEGLGFTAFLVCKKLYQHRPRIAKTKFCVINVENSVTSARSSWQNPLLFSWVSGCKWWPCI